MQKEVYVVTRFQPNPERYDLTDEEFKSKVASLNAARESAGGEIALRLGVHSSYANWIHVAKYPSLEAWLAFKDAMWRMGSAKYWTSEIAVCFDATATA
jgi:hypothetical protein